MSQQDPANESYHEPTVQAKPSDPISFRCTVVLSSDLRLGLPSDLFSSGVHTRTVQAFLLSAMPVALSLEARSVNFLLIQNVLSGKDLQILIHRLKLSNF
jgi:hypothetical protein